jgi:hypothetical protein
VVENFSEWIAAKGCESFDCSESSLLSAGQFMIAPTDLQGNNPRPDLRPDIVSNSWGNDNPNDTFYLATVQAWRAAGIITFCGYILGFPEDTAASIEHDIEILKRELPVDCLEFFVLTPLPGSEDHQKLARSGVAMERDMNKYDLEHVCTAHGRMAQDEWQGIYRRAWSQYYSMEHIETLLRRAIADGIAVKRLMLSLVVFRGMPLIEDVHPLQGGYLRRRIRRSRRPGSPSDNALLFHIRHWTHTLAKLVRFGTLVWRVNRIRRRVLREHALHGYTDMAIASLPQEAEDRLEMMQERPRLAAAQVG